MRQAVAYLRGHWIAVLFYVALFAGLFGVSRVNYLLFHALAEIFSIVVAVMLAATTWNARRMLENSYFQVLGGSFLFVGIIDLLHTLAFKDMGVFAGTTASDPNAANLGTQLWLAGRYLQSFAMVTAGFFIRRRGNFGAPLVIFGLTAAAMLGAIFGGFFPAAMLDGVGMTPFKIRSEYVFIVIYLIAIVQLVVNKDVMDPNMLQLVTLSLVFNILSEMAFTGYVQVSDAFNLLGHYFKVVSFTLLYKAIVESGVQRPQELLYRNLARSEAELQKNEVALLQNEAALRESVSREHDRAMQLEAIMDSVPAIVWIAHDPGARQVTGNRASADLLHLPPNANHSRYNPQVSESFKFYTNDGEELVLNDLPLHVSAATGRYVRDYEEKMVASDGETHYLYGNTTPLFDQKGAPSGAVGAFIDITERVHTEQALAVSEQRYRTLFSVMAEGFALQEVIMDETGQAVDYRFIEVNPAFEQLIGIHRDQLIGHNIRALLPNAISPWIEKYAQVVRSGEPAHYEGYSPLAGRYLEVLVSPVGGNVCASLSIDITERRRTREALQKSEARLRRLVDSNIIGILYSDAEGRISLANDAYLNILGYTREEYHAGLVNWKDLTPPEFLALDRERIAEANERGACTPYEKEYIRKDGQRVPVLIGYAYFDETEPLYICFVINLSEQKTAEAEARESAERLARINQELARANAELQDFAFVASHDLQEPLRKIQAFGERLNVRAGGALDENSRDYLERMLNAAGRMRTMIDDLLALSRITTRGRSFENVDLQAIVTNVLSDLEVRIERSGATVEVNELPVIEADPMQMHQLFLNLITNSLKFSQNGSSPQVRVYSEFSQNKKSVMITIEDHGIGFDEQYAERIFQPFQRLHGVGQYEGSGIGLAICKKIVERHSGAISAHSSPGAGSVFTVTLPIKQPIRSQI